ncbi:ABATE domain-containing protein [Streptomyces thermocarboxydus]
MGDAERLAAWCRGVGLTPAPGYEAEALLRSLHALRDAAYDIASSLLDGHRPPRVRGPRQRAGRP